MPLYSPFFFGEGLQAQVNFFGGGPEAQNLVCVLTSTKINKNMHACSYGYCVFLLLLLLGGGRGGPISPTLKSGLGYSQSGGDNRMVVAIWVTPSLKLARAPAP